MMRYVSTFSGVEAATLAWRPLGWEALCFAEVDAFPSAVLSYRFPEVPNLGDVTKVDWRRFRGAADLVVGGSPCQSFSVAGARTGLEGASGLMWEYVRAVRELMPRWLLWENVPGALSSTHGEDFRCLLASLDGLGYGLAWRVLDAQFFGVAQRRRRVFLVGYLGDPDPACEVLFEPESLRWDSESSKEKREALASGAGGGAGCAGFSRRLGPKTRSIGFEEERSPAPTDPSARPPAVAYTAQVRCGCEGGGKGALVQEDVSATLSTSQTQTLFEPGEKGYLVRRLTPRECERLQGMPDDWTLVPWRGKPAEECPDAPRYKAIGNSMCVNVMRWLGERVQAADEGMEPWS